jgi:hypothetical protein
MLLGIYAWQLEPLFSEPDALWAGLWGLDPGRNWQPPSSTTAAEWTPLVDLWILPEAEPDETEVLVYAFCPMLVIDYIVETHGAEKLRPMLDHLKTAESMEEWIATITDQPLDQFEMDWREWVIAQFADL